MLQAVPDAQHEAAARRQHAPSRLRLLVLALRRERSEVEAGLLVGRRRRAGDEPRQQLEELLEFDEESAGGFMTTFVVTARPSDRVDDVRAQLALA